MASTWREICCFELRETEAPSASFPTRVRIRDRRHERIISSPADAQQSDLLHLSNRERLSLSMARPAIQLSQDDASGLSEAERLSFPIVRLAVQDSGHDESEFWEAEGSSFSIARLAMPSPDYESPTASSSSAVQRTAGREPTQPEQPSPPSFDVQ